MLRILVLIALSLALAGCTAVEERLFSEEPMERRLAEQIVLTRQIGGAGLSPEAGYSSRGWVAVVEVLGSAPQPPGGADLYVRYYAGIPGVGAALTTPVAGQTGFAVAHVEDPDIPSGPVSFRFPRDGSLWETDMAELMPRQYWRGEQAGDASELETAWRERVLAIESGDAE